MIQTLREYIRQVIKESSSQTFEGLAIISQEEVDGKRAVIYDSTKLLEYVNELDENNPFDKDWRYDLGKKGITKGYIQIVPPIEEIGKCLGAWQVEFAVGPGYGKIVYACGYAMSPNGLLIPSHYSRSSVSDLAFNAWEKAYKSSRARYPLDDTRFHRSQSATLTSAMKKRLKFKHEKVHTEDDVDDCEGIGVNEHESDVLDSAYAVEGWEKSAFKSLQSSHSKTLNELAETFSYDESRLKKIEEEILSSGDVLFGEHI